MKIEISLRTAAIVYALLEVELQQHKDNPAYAGYLREAHQEYMLAFDRGLLEAARHGVENILSILDAKGTG